MIEILYFQKDLVCDKALAYVIKIIPAIFFFSKLRWLSVISGLSMRRLSLG